MRTVKKGLAATALALAACAGMAVAACSSPKDIVIGFAASMSGMDYMLGVDGRNAAMLFVDRFNAAGGLGGRRLKLELKDLASDDSLAPAAARELVRAGAVAIVGFYTSSSALAALPAMRDALVPIISPTATSEGLSGMDDYFFRTIMTSAMDPVALGGIMKAAGQSRVLFIAAAYNEPYYATYRDGLESLLTVAGAVYYGKVGEIDYASISALADGPGYDAVMIVASSVDTGTIAQALAMRGLLKPLYLSGWAGNEDVITYGGAAMEGATLVHQVDVDLARSSEMSAAYRTVFGSDPSYGAIETWDAMLFLVEGLRAAKGKPNRLYGALRGIRSFDGTAGTIAMDEYGDALRPLYSKRIRDGHFIVTGTVD